MIHGAIKQKNHLRLDNPAALSLLGRVIRCELRLIGNPVQFGDGPAAVIGDERREMPLAVCGREGAVSRTIRQSEGLPVEPVLPTRPEATPRSVDTRGIPGSMHIGPVFFWGETRAFQHM